MIYKEIDNIRKFREDRISKISVNETPVPLLEGAKVVLHLIPIDSINSSQIFDISELEDLSHKKSPMNCPGGKQRFNFDGFLTYCTDREGRFHSYVQFFRNGVVEAVDGLMLRQHGEEQVIPGEALEGELIKALRDYLSVLNALNVKPPIFVFVSLLGVSGYYMAHDKPLFLPEYESYVDRDTLLVPEVVVESYDIEPEKVLRPCFDSIWNACGYAKSLNYDENGEWTGKY
ncbi:hypothetical protein Asulf_00909 [Archaeoglobus sulfaticallidus PM70-1]|uniref:Uncharacterized protein n=1 Tax=Archaeoglobus sulfaticallidus PM70-1 TaxID=387631 RepID=N0BL28_9EURY|nr:hypothetical protein [Archaeoglobus sulfaticallidus]AGK60915.1 hypothetical protein Asulf_00909 [Archaeoglobus sulfaticallidus PM70-1]